MNPSTARQVPGGRRRRRATPGALVALGAATALALAGCGDDGDGDGGSADPTNATTAVCEELAGLRSHSEELRNKDSSATVQGIQDVRADMSDDMGKIQEAAGDAGVDVTALRAAFRELDVTMDHLDRNMNAAAALDQVTPPLDKLDKALVSTEDAAGCVRQ
ncbi:hypothetical protein [Streptomyces sp. NPDC003327]